MHSRALGGLEGGPVGRFRFLRQRRLMCFAPLLLTLDHRLTLTRDFPADSAVLPALEQPANANDGRLEEGSHAFGSGDPGHPRENTPAEHQHGEEGQGRARVTKIAYREGP